MDDEAQAESKFALPPSFSSIQTLSELDDNPCTLVRAISFVTNSDANIFLKQLHRHTEK